MHAKALWREDDSAPSKRNPYCRHNCTVASTLYLYVPDVDSVYRQAVKAGGKTVMEPTDMFYGDRSGGVKDPSGNSWFIATHKEDVAPQELPGGNVRACRSTQRRRSRGLWLGDPIAQACRRSPRARE